MAQVNKFELLHGIIIIKVLRTDGATLRLIETDAKKAWAAYTINDEVIIYVKYSLTNRETKRDSKIVWAFSFQPSELEKINSLSESKPVYAGLVCGLTDIKLHDEMQTCLLEPKQLEECIDLKSNKVQTITIEYKTRKSLRAYGPKNSEEDRRFVISRNKLDNWKIPGT
jgi:hypothetical protein